MKFLKKISIYYYDIKYGIYYNVKYGIINLIKWFPIIWKDRNWDQNYLYRIIRFKLKQMEFLQRRYGIGVDNNKYADQMRKCILLLDRIIKDDYLLESEYTIAEKRKEQDLDLLFKLIRKHVEGWWD